VIGKTVSYRKEVYSRGIWSEAKYAAYEALGPFFEIIMKGLSGVVDGDHYFDTIAEDATFEFLYEFPGWPRTIRGRAELMTAYSGYGNSIRLRSADKLVVYHADNGRVVILEYEVHGKVLGTGGPYDNRFVSIITVADRKIVHWRDYMDSLAAWNALNPAVLLMSLIWPPCSETAPVHGRTEPTVPPNARARVTAWQTRFTTK
jgi:uncharacterized protein